MTTTSVAIPSPSAAHQIIFDRTAARMAIIAGPCVVEDAALLETVATELVRLQELLPVDFVFKASYRKANRTSATSFTGIGDAEALALLASIRTTFDLPVLTDIHTAEEAAIAAKSVDVLQIPAFLARQTELLHAAGATGRVVNVKKGQFMAAEDMQYAIQKISNGSNARVLLTERGTFFGYGDLVVDFRSLVKMAAFGAPIIYDATHSVQRPSQAGRSGGERQYIAPLARAAMAVGVDGIFLETHPDPAHAKSDRDTQLPLSELEGFIRMLLTYRNPS